MHSNILQTQTDPELSTEFTEDDMRLNSSHSRASLRNQFRNRLEESRHAAEERRSKSPAISVPSQRSIDDQLVEDDDFPIPDEIKGQGLSFALSKVLKISKEQFFYKKKNELSDFFYVKKRSRIKIRGKYSESSQIACVRDSK